MEPKFSFPWPERSSASRCPMTGVSGPKFQRSFISIKLLSATGF